MNPSWVRSSSGISRPPEKSKSCSESSRPSVNQALMSLPSGTSRMSTMGSIGGRFMGASRDSGATLAELFLGCWVGLVLRGLFHSLDSRGDGDGKLELDGSVTLPRTFPDVDSCASFCFGFILVLRSFRPLPDEFRPLPDFELEFLADPSLLWSLSLSPFFNFVLPAKGSAEVGIPHEKGSLTKSSCQS